MPENVNSNDSITIPDGLCKAAGVTMQWAGVGTFGVHAFRPLQYNTNDEPSEFAPAEAKVHYVRPDSILFEPLIRKLVNESNGAFCRGQRLGPSNTIRPETLKLSRQYRSIVRACIESLQETKTLAEAKRLQYVSVFYKIEIVWHLCEILFVDAVPGNVVLPLLLDWIRFHFPDVERSAGLILTGSGSGSLDRGAERRHENYWHVVTGLIMQGNMQVARALLRLHSDADSNQFMQAEVLLRSMPVYTVYGGLSSAEFKTRWHTWQTNVTSKLEFGTFNSYPQLVTIMKIISADADAIEEMRSLCDSWYQLLVAVLLYKDPTVKSFELSQYTNVCIDAFGGHGHLKLLDHIILALLECNVIEVMKKLYQMPDSGWCVTHLTNLLYLVGQLDGKEKYSEGRLDEYLIVEYGSLLMSHNSLWQVGVSYLDYCPTKGTTCLELLLPRLKLGAEHRILKIIQIAADRNLSDVVNTICKVEGMRCLQRKRIGQALCWAMRSQDPGFTAHIADNLLQYYVREGVFHALDLLDNLGSCMLISDRLTFLAKYCEFLQLYKNGALREAATLVTILFTSKTCPQYFWLTFLSDALPLLEEHDPPILTSEDSSELLVRLEELAMSKSAQTTHIVEKIRLLRIALGKNLAKSLIYEACHPSFAD